MGLLARAQDYRFLEAGEEMKRIALVAIAVMLALGTAAFAGTLHGKVSGVSGESVVYIEAVAGKTFPAPAQHITIDQKGLMFVPHITVVQQGATVEFLNSDSVAHNVFWPAISGNKKLGHNLGTWPQGQRKSFKFDDPGVVSLLCNETTPGSSNLKDLRWPCGHVPRLCPSFLLPLIAGQKTLCATLS